MNDIKMKTIDNDETPTITYKKYIGRPTGYDRIPVSVGNGYVKIMRRMVYAVERPDGQGIGKAWSKIEIKALVNEDLRILDSVGGETCR